jgi:hypothetical protein
MEPFGASHRYGNGADEEGDEIASLQSELGGELSSGIIFFNQIASI